MEHSGRKGLIIYAGTQYHKYSVNITHNVYNLKKISKIKLICHRSCLRISNYVCCKASHEVCSP